MTPTENHPAWEPITPAAAYQTMHDDPDALMVDVRTFPESYWVGVPDLTAITSRDVPLIPWELVPGSPNPQFLNHMRQEAPDMGQVVIVFSRSGERSAKASTALAEAGYTRVYNMTHGFDGDRDSDGHRSTQNGWRAAGLPWFQQ